MIQSLCVRQSSGVVVLLYLLSFLYKHRTQINSSHTLYNIPFEGMSTSSSDDLNRARRQNFTKEETLALLSIWQAKMIPSQRKELDRQIVFWEYVASSMAELGYNRSEFECRTRVHNLQTKFNNTKNCNEDPGSFPYYDLMSTVLDPTVMKETRVATAEAVTDKGRPSDGIPGGSRRRRPSAAFSDNHSAVEITDLPVEISEEFIGVLVNAFTNSEKTLEERQGIGFTLGRLCAVSASTKEKIISLVSKRQEELRLSERLVSDFLKQF